jgi:anti-sigma B factor antagonist
MTFTGKSGSRVAKALINTHRQTDGSVTVEVRGEVDLGCSDRLCRVLVDMATRVRPTRLVVDLLHVTFIDSTGIGALVAGRNAARTVGIRFTLRHPSAFVATQLRQTGLQDLLGTDG